MTTRSERFFCIVQILRRARRPLTAQQIASELEITRRTVYRDIAALKAQGVPVSGEAGLGYVLEPGFDMPPLMLSPQEVEAALLGAQWVMTRGEPALARAAEDLVGKLGSLLPEALRSLVVTPTLSVAPNAGAAERATDPAMHGAELRRALREERKVELTYIDEGGRETARTVWPVLLGYRDSGRILAAWCELREGFRYFREDRMIRARVLDSCYPERRVHLRARWQEAMAVERMRFADAR